MTTEAAPASTTSPSANGAPSFNRTGFTNLYVLQSTEMAAIFVLNYLETLETKGASNADAKILIKINDKGVDYAEVANNMIQEYYLLTLAKTIDLWK
jgi:hypothetical protein